jgi:hypothetical protein
MQRREKPKGKAAELRTANKSPGAGPREQGPAQITTVSIGRRGLARAVNVG